MADSARRRHLLVVSLHDVCPSSWPTYTHFLDELERHCPDLPLTHLVVPDFHGQGPVNHYPEFCRAMERQLSQGNELVLHGYRHADEGPYPRSPPDWVRRRLLTHEGEFACAGRGEAESRIDAARAIFASLGWPCSGFVAPGWLYSPQTIDVLKERGFRWYSDHRHLHDLGNDRHLTLPTLVWSARSQWRRALSQCWNRWQLRRQRQQVVIRLALHPVDLEHAMPRRFWLETIRILSTERHAVSKFTLLGDMP